jgi:membrane protein implicated in regulation of membrane protease activity
MNATATRPTGSRHTAAETFEEIAPVVAVRRGAGPSLFLLVGPWLLLVLLLIPPAAVLISLMLLVALPFLAVALVGAVVASPFLLVRAIQRRVAERRESRKRSVRAAARVAPIARPTQQPGFAALTPSINQER